jgi:predicted RNase H-like HicB family nuclease
MLYPVYVHPGDDKTAHGIIFPDFPGCFSAADRWEEIPVMAQEAIEAHMGGENLPIPEPSQLEKLVHESEYSNGGIWMLLEIDVSRIDPSPQRVNISLPRNLLTEIDAYATQHHQTRSGFLADAARRVISAR